MVGKYDQCFHIYRICVNLIDNCTSSLYSNLLHIVLFRQKVKHVVYVVINRILAINILKLTTYLSITYL